MPDSANEGCRCCGEVRHRYRDKPESSRLLLRRDDLTGIDVAAVGPGARQMGELTMTGQKVGMCVELGSTDDETPSTGSVEVLRAAVALS